jgi:hypothetical protein
VLCLHHPTDAEIMLKRLKCDEAGNTLTEVIVASCHVSIKKLIEVSADNKNGCIKEVTRMLPRSDISEPPAIHLSIQLHPE